MLSETGTEALRMTKLGIPVLALAPGSKKPQRGSKGVRDATTSMHVVDLWWSTTPAANLGFACGVKFDVLDIDPRSGGRWPAGQTMPLHGIVGTPSGGWHLYVPVGWLYDSTRRGKGWDYQAAGSYVVGPPSPGYRWLQQWSDEAAEVMLPVFA